MSRLTKALSFGEVMLSKLLIGYADLKQASEIDVLSVGVKKS